MSIFKQIYVIENPSQEKMEEEIRRLLTGSKGHHVLLKDLYWTTSPFAELSTRNTGYYYQEGWWPGSYRGNLMEERNGERTRADSVDDIVEACKEIRKEFPYSNNKIGYKRILGLQILWFTCFNEPAVDQGNKDQDGGFRIRVISRVPLSYLFSNQHEKADN